MLARKHEPKSTEFWLVYNTNRNRRSSIEMYRTRVSSGKDHAEEAFGLPGVRRPKASASSPRAEAVMDSFFFWSSTAKYFLTQSAGHA